MNCNPMYSGASGGAWIQKYFKNRTKETMHVAIGLNGASNVGSMKRRKFPNGHDDPPKMIGPIFTEKTRAMLLAAVKKTR